MRIDVYLAEKGLAKSRSAAQNLIAAGAVSVNGKVVSKPSFDIDEGGAVEIDEKLRPKYVGRGGIKLERALEVFNISVGGKKCLDVGASSGGFTDVMLQNGAESVTALDVGTAQLDEKLRADARVMSLENTDVRDFFPEERFDFIAADVSFISLRLIMGDIFRLLAEGGQAVVLVKPQFEAKTLGIKGRVISKKGIVTDEKVRKKALFEVKKCAEECGFSVMGEAPSPIKGGDGNEEFLLAITN